MKCLAPPGSNWPWSWQVLGLDADGAWISRAPFMRDAGTPESVYYSIGR